jgi:hypothetical protein
MLMQDCPLGSTRNIWTALNMVFMPPSRTHCLANIPKGDGGLIYYDQHGQKQGGWTFIY